MTTVFLAYGSGGVSTLERHRHEEAVDMLVAYPVLDHFQKNREKINVRSWILDSGAFSVFNSGKTIKLEEYIAACREVQDDAKIIFGLDVIGDAPATRRNVEEMHAAGIDAVPTFHYGSPWEHLEWCAQFPRLALGGVARLKSIPTKVAWLSECFARVWPKKIHGFGIVGDDPTSRLPFTSVDASSWMSPRMFGTWRSLMRTSALRVYGVPADDMWSEVRYYLRLQERLESRWGATLAREFG
jgi:hypothetical protein